MNSHRGLAVWKAAGELIREIYAISATLPPDERFVAIPQLRRAAWSVQNNIAEGLARRGRAELRRFIDISLASLAEIDSMLGTLETLYPLPTERLERTEILRRLITAGTISLGRGRPVRTATQRPASIARAATSRPTPPTPPTPPQDVVKQ